MTDDENFTLNNNIKELTYQSIIRMIERPNVSDDTINALIEYAKSAFNEWVNDIKPLMVFIYFIKNINKINEEQANIIKVQLYNFFKNNSNIFVGNNNYYDMLMFKYDKFDTDYLIDLFHVIPYKLKLIFFENNIELLQKDMDFITRFIDSSWFDDKEIKKVIYKSCFDRDIIEYICINKLIQGFVENLDIEELLKNQNIDDDFKYLIILIIENLLNDRNYSKEAKKILKLWKKQLDISDIKMNDKEKELSKKVEKILSKYVKPSKEFKSDTSLIQVTDEFELNNDVISIKPENFDLIAADNKDIIKYGTYPNGSPNAFESDILDLLYASKQLEQEQTEFSMFINNQIITTKVFIYKGNRYIRIKQGFKSYIWLKFSPILWKVNKENKSLDFDYNIYHMDTSLNEFMKKSPYEFNNYINNIFKKQIIEHYIITKEDKKLKHEIEKDNKIKTVKHKFEDIQDEEFIQRKTKEEEHKKIIKKFFELQEAIESYQKNFMVETNEFSNQKTKIKLEDSLLIIKVKDHLEFNPEYIPFIKYIDLSLIGSKKLKISGIDFRGTNIRIDPQMVYQKDLSNCKFDDNNLVFANFNGCNLSGADLSSETESISSIGNAIIDENTKLPISLQSGTIIHK